MNKLSKKELTDITVKFCETIKDAGYIPGVYTSASYFVSELNYSDIAGYEIWVARYINDGRTYKYPSQISDINSYIKKTYNYDNKYDTIKADMWQYTQKGIINGLTVDMNIGYKTY